NPFGAEPESPERPPRFGRPSGCSWWVTLPVLILANYLVVSLLFPDTGGPVEVPYSLFREQVVAGNVATIATRGDTIQGVFSAPIQFTADLPSTPDDAPAPDPVAVQSFSTTLPIFV